MSAIQNQHGNQPLKWDKGGVVVSCEGFDKYGPPDAPEQVTLETVHTGTIGDKPQTAGQYIISSC